MIREKNSDKRHTINWRPIAFLNANAKILSITQKSNTTVNYFASASCLRKKFKNK